MEMSIGINPVFRSASSSTLRGKSMARRILATDSTASRVLQALFTMILFGHLIACY
jgi:hypothetical protein